MKILVPFFTLPNHRPPFDFVSPTPELAFPLSPSNTLCFCSYLFLLREAFEAQQLLVPMAKKKEIWGLSVSLILINLAAIMEKADESLLPAVYKEVSEAFNATPSKLGYLTFFRAFVQALSSPLAGILAMRYHRPSVVGFGTLFWAFSTAAMGFSQTFAQCAFWRAVNGIGLAIVIPALQSFIADSYFEEGRGVAFGWLSLVGSVGGIGGSVSATVLAGYSFGSLPGWRLAFLLVAVGSLLIGWLVHLFVVDPKETALRFVPQRHQSGKPDVEENVIVHPSMWKDAFIAIRSVLKVRTFQIIVLQGLVGSLPWNAMVFFTMWFELIGFGHKGAATLTGVFATSCAVGSLLGGWIADMASRKYPAAGRIMCAQFSSFMGIPFSIFLLLVLHQEPDRWISFAITLTCMGLTISWCQACANNPMFAEVVPANQRTMIYAFDRAFEGSFSALGPPIVGLVAENFYGYRVNKNIPETGSPGEAYALSRGLFAVMAVPFGLCCLLYTPLYRTYKRDHDEANYHSSL